MSITKRLKKIKKIKTNTYVNEYVRPSNWLPLPNIVAGEQVVYGLHAIRPGGETVSFDFNNDMIIDWGDGSAIETASTGASHVYDFDTYDVFNETLTEDGYKQVIIKIVPAGLYNIEVLNFNIANPDMPTMSKGWMDMVISAAYLEELTFATDNFDYPLFEQFEFVGENLITNFANMFQYLMSIKKIVRFDTSKGIDFTSMFDGCNYLMSIPTFDLSSGTTFNNMFRSCINLEYAPAFNMSSAIDATGMFIYCSNLKFVAPFTLGSLEIANTMFAYCTALNEIPMLDLSTVTSSAEMFSSCPIKKVPLYDLSLVTDATSMFYECYNLVEIPALDLGSATDLTGIFGYTNFSSLKSINVINVATDLSVEGLPLDAAALINIFNNLADGVVTKNMNVIGCPGTVDLQPEDIAIAEDKGWTVITA